MKEFPTWFIYALVDPRDQQVRYVGFTSETIKKRFQRHLDDAFRYEYHRCKWIRSLLKEGLMPQAIQLEEGHFGDWGVTPPEVRAKMSASHKGKSHSQEHRENQRLANKRKKLSDQDIREIRALKGTLTQKQLGERYGVDRSAISRIHRGLMGVVVKDYTTPSQTASEGKVK